MADKPFNLLFLCTGNSARSILAEAITNAIDPALLRGFSAGSFPAGKVNPFALELLERNHFPIEGLRSKNWDEFAAPGAPTMDFIFTVCDNAAAEACPVWPGKPVSAHWGVADPAAVQGSDEAKRKAFLETFVILKRRIELFASLPVASLDKLALASRLRDIGRA